TNPGSLPPASIQNFDATASAHVSDFETPRLPHARPLPYAHPALANLSGSPSRNPSSLSRVRAPASWQLKPTAPQHPSPNSTNPPLHTDGSLQNFPDRTRPHPTPQE